MAAARRRARYRSPSYFPMKSGTTRGPPSQEYAVRNPTFKVSSHFHEKNKKTPRLGKGHAPPTPPRGEVGTSRRATVINRVRPTPHPQGGPRVREGGIHSKKGRDQTFDEDIQDTAQRGRNTHCPALQRGAAARPRPSPAERDFAVPLSRGIRAPRQATPPTSAPHEPRSQPITIVQIRPDRQG